MHLNLFLFMISFSKISKSTNVPNTNTKCPKWCSCDKTQLRLSVDCSYKKLTSVPDFSMLQDDEVPIDLYLNGNIFSHILGTSLWFVGSRLRSLQIIKNERVFKISEGTFSQPHYQLKILKLGPVENDLEGNLKSILKAKTLEKLYIETRSSIVTKLELPLAEKVDNLKVLHIHDSGISSIGHMSIAGMKLRELGLSKNLMKEFPIVLWYMISETLKILYLDDNRIMALKKNQIPNGCKLRKLFLQHNSISVLESGTIDRCEDLEIINLAGNSPLGFLDPALFVHFDNLQLDLRNTDINRFDFIASHQVEVIFAFNENSLCSCKEVSPYLLKFASKLRGRCQHPDSKEKVDIREVCPVVLSAAEYVDSENYDVPDLNPAPIYSHQRHSQESQFGSVGGFIKFLDNMFNLRGNVHSRPDNEMRMANNEMANHGNKKITDFDQFDDDTMTEQTAGFYQDGENQRTKVDSPERFSRQMRARRSQDDFHLSKLENNEMKTRNLEFSEEVISGIQTLPEREEQTRYLSIKELQNPDHVESHIQDDKLDDDAIPRNFRFSKKHNRIQPNRYPPSTKDEYLRIDVKEKDSNANEFKERRKLHQNSRKTKVNQEMKRSTTETGKYRDSTNIGGSEFNNCIESCKNKCFHQFYRGNNRKSFADTKKRQAKSEERINEEKEKYQNIDGNKKPIKISFHENFDENADSQNQYIRQSSDYKKGHEKRLHKQLHQYNKGNDKFQGQTNIKEEESIEMENDKMYDGQTTQIKTSSDDYFDERSLDYKEGHGKRLHYEQNGINGNFNHHSKSGHHDGEKTFDENRVSKVPSYKNNSRISSDGNIAYSTTTDLNDIPLFACILMILVTYGALDNLSRMTTFKHVNSVLIMEHFLEKIIFQIRDEIQRFSSRKLK